MNSATVRKFRRALGMTRFELAQAVKVKPATVDRWEGEPDATALARLRKLAESRGRADLGLLVFDKNDDPMDEILADMIGPPKKGRGAA